jgi:hypothetical protein
MGLEFLRVRVQFMVRVKCRNRFELLLWLGLVLGYGCLV